MIRKTKRINGLKGLTGPKKKKKPREVKGQRTKRTARTRRADLDGAREWNGGEVTTGCNRRCHQREETAERKSSNTGDGSRSPLMDVARRTARSRACARPYKAPEGGQSDGSHCVSSVRNAPAAVA